MVQAILEKAKQKTDFSLEELDIINHLMAMRVSDFDESAKSDDLAA